MRTVGIGVQDFDEIRVHNLFYVDKTKFIREWWESYDAVTLIIRPRRFGKTLTMSMVERFFSVQYAGQGEIFEGLEIWEEEAFRELQGSYPVISLSFADCFGFTEQEVFSAIDEMGLDDKKNVESLLSEEAIIVPIDEEIVFSQLDEDEDTVWSLLLASGYLKIVSISESGYELKIVNYEVLQMLKKLVRGWFKREKMLLL